MPRLKPVSLTSFFDYCVENKLPCAFYRLPGTAEIRVIAQNTPGLTTLKSYNDKGFLFSPFQAGKSAQQVLIKPDIFTSSKKLPGHSLALNKTSQKVNKTKPVKLKTTSKKAYQQYVKDILKNIRKGHLEKAVAARIVLQKKPVHFDAVQFFERLSKTYLDSFVSLVYTPEYGFWTGATPEVLLQSDKSGYKTYSLAGTRANKPKNFKSDWSDKEKHEHEIVSNYILRAFESVTGQKPQVTGPETIGAGNLLHLLTVFQQAPVKGVNWLQLVEKLHPTPAVAGLPAKSAIKVILKNEKSGRSFYTGYLGPVNMNHEVGLFVNLRCMQVLKKQLALYVGCGIVAGSVPEDEWKESTLKTQTLLNVLT